MEINIMIFGVIILVLFQAGIFVIRFAKTYRNLEKISRERYNELTYDRVTGLMKRTSFISDVEKIENPLIFLIKPDNLRNINDYFGYECVEGVLKYFAEILNKMELEYKKGVYKTDNDEFILLFDAKLSIDDREIIARYLHEYLTENRYKYNDDEIFSTLFIGVAALSEDRRVDEYKGRKGIEILSNASIAMTDAKSHNKWYVIYNDVINGNKEYGEILVWAKKTRKAIEENRIVVYYQPIINNGSGKIEKYEALIRMIETSGKVVQPLHFLKVSRVYHLYSYLTKIVIEKSFEKFRESDKEFSINISVADILDKSTNNFIIAKIKEYKNAKNIVFEILETEGIEQYDEVGEFIKTVKESGCKIAIDDFGSGYSNFEHILKLDVDYLKIDGSLIRNIDKDTNSEIITTNIVEFSRKIGLKTIAEYVHSEEVYEKVKKIGVDFSQGFYLGEPGEDIEK